MAGFFIGFFTIILILLCLFVVLLVLMQRPSANAGMGASLGGGAAESAFGAESGNVLTRWTIYCTVGFFVLVFGLYLASMSRREVLMTKSNGGLPSMIVPEVDPSEEYTPGALTEMPQESNSE